MKKENRWILFVILSAFVLIGASSSAFAFSKGSRVCVTASIANMRMEPSTKSEILWSVEKYHPLIVVTSKGKWYQVKDFEGHIAWIHNSLVGKGRCVITTKRKCNIRSKPIVKKEYEHFTADRGVPFKVIEKKGNWYNVIHKEGDTGWIHKSLVW